LAQAEERAAAAAAALLEEEDRAAAKGGSTKKRRKKGKKMGGAAVQTQPSTQPPRDHGLRGTLEPSETPGEAQVGDGAFDMDSTLLGDPCASVTQPSIICCNTVLYPLCSGSGRSSGVDDD
jgi:hypothetical protein